MKFRQRAQSVLIIGLGRFGRHLAIKLMELGNEVMVVDKSEAAVQRVSEVIEDIFIGDCTNEAVVKSLGVGNFDICLVSIGGNFEASVVITSLLKKMGARYIVTKSGRDIQADILKQIGADEVIYPERILAEKLAVRMTKPNIVDFIELTPDYVIYEIAAPDYRKGKTISKIDVRKKDRISILCIKSGNRINTMPTPDYEFFGNEQIVVSGKTTDIERLMNNYN